MTIKLQNYSVIFRYESHRIELFFFENMVHPMNVRSGGLHILASMFQILLLRAEDLLASRASLAAFSGSENLNKVSFMNFNHELIPIIWKRTM